MERVGEIARYIAEHDPVAARRWVNEVFDRVDALPPYVRRAPRVREIDRDDIRQILDGRYRIIFRIRDDAIEVLTVRHGAQRLQLDEDIGT